MTDSTQKKILVVENSPQMRPAIYMCLMAAGFGVSVANSAEEGLQALKNLAFPFDAVVTSINLPGHSGIWLTQKLREHPQYKVTPIILFYSPTATQEDLNKAARAGVSTMVAKLDGTSALLSKVRQLLI